MASHNQLSMIDGLTQIETTISQMKMSPDADIDFLTDLEHVVLAKAKAGGGQQGQPSGGNPPPGGGPGAAGPPGSPPDQSSPQGQSPPGGQPPNTPGQNQMSGPPNSQQGMQYPKPPNPDELRRFLETRAGR